MSVKFIAPYPISVNKIHQVARGRLILTDAARAYKLQLGYLAMGNCQGVFFPYECLLSMTLRLYRPEKRGDVANFDKIVFDAMNGILYEDDEQFIHNQNFRYDDKDNPRVEIEITQVATRPTKKRNSKLI